MLLQTCTSLQSELRCESMLSASLLGCTRPAYRPIAHTRPLLIRTLTAAPTVHAALSFDAAAAHIRVCAAKGPCSVPGVNIRSAPARLDLHGVHLHQLRALVGVVAAVFILAGPARAHSRLASTSPPRAVMLAIKRSRRMRQPFCCRGRRPLANTGPAARRACATPSTAWWRASTRAGAATGCTA